MLSSSRKGEQPYLTGARPYILDHLSHTQNVLFVPYAGVSISFDDYTQKVAEVLPELTVTGIHQTDDPARAIENASAIIVGGGNTFSLLSNLYNHRLVELLKVRLQAGTPYIGWSAGANICGATIKTTNDMPIVQPKSFDALAVLPCQINPHYSDYHPPGFNGETRDQRLGEFTTMYPDIPVVAIKEGTALLRQENTLTYLGEEESVVFLGQNKQAIQPNADLSHLLFCE
ncbi:dipeptidase PepE [Alteromonas sediminis]|uniref:Dipeptidase PepE n=1 Tax=Alteromonas sediminis TaxID=2259342 RepID=A0A3N5YFJ4_9ALTE|nr:dipeptidase PepE [Alteromonas sediminis]RPJ68845.1 dipeptidase PepE [Alteromonas sediminis]